MRGYGPFRGLPEFTFRSNFYPIINKLTSLTILLVTWGSGKVRELFRFGALLLRALYIINLIYGRQAWQQKMQWYISVGWTTIFFFFFVRKAILRCLFSCTFIRLFGKPTTQRLTLLLFKYFWGSKFITSMTILGLWLEWKLRFLNSLNKNELTYFKWW